MSPGHALVALALAGGTLLTPWAAHAALDMQLADRIAGGDVQSIAVSGSHVFVAANATAYVVDLASPAGPRRIAYLDCEGAADHLLVDGPLLYMAAGGDLEIYDVTDPAQPVRISRLEIGGWQLKFGLQGSRLYVAAGDAGLVVVDVFDPAEPVVRGQYTEPALSISDVHVEGTTAYCAAGIFELDIFIGYLYTFEVSGWSPIKTSPSPPADFFHDLPRRIHYRDPIVYLATGGNTERRILSPETALPAWDFLATSFQELGSDLVSG